MRNETTGIISHIAKTHFLFGDEVDAHMDIKELRSRKRQLEGDIKFLLTEFEKEADVRIMTVRVERAGAHPNPEVSKVKVVVSLGD